MILIGLPALKACVCVNIQPRTEGGCWVLEEAVSLAVVTEGGNVLTPFLSGDQG